MTENDRNFYLFYGYKREVEILHIHDRTELFITKFIAKMALRNRHYIVDKDSTNGNVFVSRVDKNKQTGEVILRKGGDAEVRRYKTLKAFLWAIDPKNKKGDYLAFKGRENYFEPDTPAQIAARDKRRKESNKHLAKVREYRVRKGMIDG